MLYIVILFLIFSLVLYTLLGGADFGAGILELFRGKSKTGKSEELTNKAIGPVWEANHMWLIIMIVILFMGFPDIYTALSIYLHIPLTALLIGIVLRGCFFTFRHYDLIQDESDKVYSFIFAISSLATSFFIGIIAGSLRLGWINPDASDFLSLYITPWFNLFSISVGIFTSALFAFLAAVYLIGESPGHVNPRLLIRQALNANIAIVFSGILVFVAAYIDNFDLFGSFINSPSTAFALVIATAILPVLWKAIKGGKVLLSRMLAGTQVLCILYAWFWDIFPYIMLFKNGKGINIFAATAPAATISVLGWALVFGSVFIIPALIYLLITFKKES